MPVARLQLPPTAVNVSGPGPTESHQLGATEDPVAPPLLDAAVSKPTPPIPTEDSENGDDASDDGAEGTDEGRANRDPYANLDGAFGNYLADQPRPMNAGGRQGDDDDLLF